MGNISWGDGSAVEILADSPDLVIFDPLAIDDLHAHLREAVLGSSPRNILSELRNDCEVAHYEISDFAPGLYQLQMKDIRKFDSEESEDDERWAPGEWDEEIDPDTVRWFGTDSAAIVVVAFSHLKQFADVFSWEKYDRACRGEEQIIAAITETLGGPYFAIIMSPGEPYEFDGDGTYTLQAGAAKYLGSRPISA
jgi:hypothetical protein